MDAKNSDRKISFLDSLAVLCVIMLLPVLGWGTYQLASFFSDAKPEAPKLSTNPTSTQAVLPASTAADALVAVNLVQEKSAVSVSPFDVIDDSADVNVPETHTEQIAPMGEPGKISSLASLPTGFEDSSGFSGQSTNDANGRPEQPIVDNWPGADVEIDKTSAIAGRVMSTQGQPLGNHSITYVKSGSESDITGAVETDSRGIFQIFGLETGEYLLKTQEHAVYDSRSVRVRTGTRTLTIVLAHLNVVKVEGQVTDMQNQPVIGAQVSSPLTDQQVTTDDKGHYQMLITGAIEQGFPVRFEARGFIPESRFVPRQTGGSEALATIRLEASLRRGNFSVPGVVYDAQGQPVVAALVQINSDTADLRISTTTDEDGRFVLETVVASRDYNLRVSASQQYKAIDVAGLELSEYMQELAFTLEFTPFGTLQGTIVNGIGMPVRHLNLLVRSEEKARRASTILTNDSGEFTLENFAAGKFNLRSQAAPDVRIRGLELSAGEYANRTLIVDMGDNLLFGMITDPAGMPLSAARVSMEYVLRDDSGYESVSRRIVTTDEEGNFEFEGVGTGERLLVISSEGYPKERVRVDPMINPGPHNIMIEYN